jgi:hypothetical protein
MFKAEMKFRVRTPTAVFGVRGTKFFLDYAEGRGTNLIVLEGIVELQSLDGSKSVNVSAGYAAGVTADGVVIEPYRVDLTNIRRWWEE